MEKIYESGENYLETILRMDPNNGGIRITDLANELGYAKPSVSRAMTNLCSKGLAVKQSSLFFLTHLGKEKAMQVYDRHQTIAQFLVLSIHLAPEAAEKDACRIEHVIEEDTFLKMKKYVQENKTK